MIEIFWGFIFLLKQTNLIFCQSCFVKAGCVENVALKSIYCVKSSVNNYLPPCTVNTTQEKITLLYNITINRKNYTFLPKGLFNGYMFDHINLSTNQIETISDDAFINQTKMLTLDLSFNKIKIITSSHFKWLSKLKYLDLSNNQLRNISDNIFIHIKSLNYLILSFNVELNLFTCACSIPIDPQSNS